MMDDHTSTSWGSLVRAQYGPSHAAEPKTGTATPAPKTRTAHTSAHTRAWNRLKTVFLAAVFLALLMLLGHTEARFSDAEAAWAGPVVSSHYGPGLFGNRTACGQTLTRRTFGVAHRSAPCGTRVSLRYRGRVVRVRVIDRGPFVHDRTFDLTERTARRLCGCGWWGIRAHAYRWGWV